MSCSRASNLVLLLVLLLPSLLAASSPSLDENFIQCVTLNSKLFPIPCFTTFFHRDPAFTLVLNSTAMKFRYVLPSVPVPLFIFTPLHESYVQAAVICSKQLGVHHRIHSGGHDYEGVSYAATVNDHPFMVLDFQRLRSVGINIGDETEWVKAGATLGELYYKIAEKTMSMASELVFVQVSALVAIFQEGPMVPCYESMALQLTMSLMLG